MGRLTIRLSMRRIQIFLTKKMKITHKIILHLNMLTKSTKVFPYQKLKALMKITKYRILTFMPEGRLKIHLNSGRIKQNDNSLF